MKEILLSGERKQVLKKNKVYAIVDDADYEYLMQWKWQAFIRNHTTYATRRMALKDGSVTVYMHRQIMGLPISKVECDHIDHNGLNNQKINLRLCNDQQNSWNRTSKKTGTSKYLGVSLCNDKRKGYKYWIVRLSENGKSLFLGSFPFTPEGEIQAAKKYDEQAKIRYGEFANLNF